MTPEEIYETYTLSTVLEQAGANIFVQYMGTSMSGKFLLYDATLVRGAQTYRFSFTESKDMSWTPEELKRQALNHARVDIDLLYEIYASNDYEKWLDNYHANLGAGGNDSRAVFEEQLKRYEGFKRVMGDDLPLFLYSENDI